MKKRKEVYFMHIGSWFSHAESAGLKKDVGKYSVDVWEFIVLRESLWPILKSHAPQLVTYLVPQCTLVMTCSSS